MLSVSILARSSNNMISYNQAVAEFNRLYPMSAEVTKVQLKCWLYYCECRARGGKDALPFPAFKKYMRAVDYIDMLNGMIIDCSDLGGVARAKDLIYQRYMDK